MWVVIWFVVLRPQKKQEKERLGRVNALRKGDKVRTKGGVIAPVVRIKDDEVVLGLAGDGRAEMVVHKSYIDEVYASSDGAKGKGDEADGK
jgi:preprotein translocase subunit YajC